MARQLSCRATLFSVNDAPTPDDGMPPEYERVDHLLTPEAFRALAGPNNPAHGQPDHTCIVEVLTGEPASVIIDMALDNVPIPWLLAKPDERQEQVSQWADDFRRDLEGSLIRSGRIKPGDSASREDTVRAINHLAQTRGKPPKVMLDALGLSESDIDSAILAAHDQSRQERAAQLRQLYPELFPEDGADVLAALAADMAPEGMEMWDGVPVPVEEAARMRAEQAANPGPYTADNHLKVELGDEPFMLIRLSQVAGTSEHVRRLRVDTGGGAEVAHVALELIESAGRQVMRQVEKLAAEHSRTGCDCKHDDHGEESNG